MTDLPLHFEASATIVGSAEGIFAVVDEPNLLTRHMRVVENMLSEVQRQQDGAVH